MVGFALEAPALPASATTGSSENTSRAEVAISSASRGSRGASAGACEASSAPAAASPSPSKRSSGSPASPRALAYPSRTPVNSTIGSDSSRRATNASTAPVGRSSHWASSTISSSGERAAASASNSSAGRQTLSPGEDRFQELMQPRKWEVGLCLHARGGQDHHAVLPGPPARRRQQRRLPDTSLTGNHQRATARADAVDQIIEQPELTLATDQGKQVHLAAMIIRPRRPVQGGPCDAEHLASATLRGR